MTYFYTGMISYGKLSDLINKPPLVMNYKLLESETGIEFKKYSPEFNLDIWDKGRIFGEKGEIKWQKIDGNYQTVYIGEEKLPGILQREISDLHLRQWLVITSDTINKSCGKEYPKKLNLLKYREFTEEELKNELENLDFNDDEIKLILKNISYKDSKGYFLWGEISAGKKDEWIELRIPKILKYDVSGYGDRVKLEIVEYINSEGITELYRYKALEEVIIIDESL